MKKCLRDRVLLMVFSCGDDILVILENGNNVFHNFSRTDIMFSMFSLHIKKYIYIYIYVSFF